MLRGAFTIFACVSHLSCLVHFLCLFILLPRAAFQGDTPLTVHHKLTADRKGVSIFQTLNDKLSVLLCLLHKQPWRLGRFICLCGQFICFAEACNNADGCRVQSQAWQSCWSESPHLLLDTIKTKCSWQWRAMPQLNHCIALACNLKSLCSFPWLQNFPPPWSTVCARRWVFYAAKST